MSLITSRNVRVSNLKTTSFFIEHCSSVPGDHCVAIKSKMPAARRAPVERITVSDCVLYSEKFGNAATIGLELRTDTIDDILFCDIHVLHTDGAAFSIDNANAATVANVRLENLWVESANQLCGCACSSLRNTAATPGRAR